MKQALLSLLFAVAAILSGGCTNNKDDACPHCQKKGLKIDVEVGKQIDIDVEITGKK